MTTPYFIYQRLRSRDIDETERLKAEKIANEIAASMPLAALAVRGMLSLAPA